VAVAAEEAAKEVEGVVASSAASALTVLLDAIVAPFVVYFACVFVA
jgi:membrane glycosyltransferase